MKEFIMENILAIITTLFGGGSFWAYLSEKKKRKIEEKQMATDALKGMQEAYDRFTEDSMIRYNELKKEVDDLKLQLKDVNKKLQEERIKFGEELIESKKQISILEIELKNCLEGNSTTVSE